MLLSPAYRSSLAGAGVHMAVNVDQAGTDEEPSHIDRFHGIRRINLRGDCSDLSSGDRNVPYRGNAISRIDEVTALKQQVVSRRRGGVNGQQDGKDRLRHDSALATADCRLRTHLRRAIHLAPRYSPMSRSPDISFPEIVPVNANDSESPVCPP